MNDDEQIQLWRFNDLSQFSERYHTENAIHEHEKNQLQTRLHPGLFPANAVLSAG